MQGSKEKLRIIIHTNLFEIKFFWNKKTVLSQIILLFILFLVRQIGFTHAIKSLCTLGIMIDIGFILVMFLPGFYFSTEMAVPGSDDSREVTSNTTAGTEQVEINHSSDNAGNVVREVNATIDNTVGGSVTAPTSAASNTPQSQEPASDDSAPDFSGLSSMFDTFNTDMDGTDSGFSDQTQEADLDDSGIFDLFSNF